MALEVGRRREEGGRVGSGFIVLCEHTSRGERHVSHLANKERGVVEIEDWHKKYIVVCAGQIDDVCDRLARQMGVLERQAKHRS